MPGTRKLSHVDRGGKARMVDVSAKPATERMAIAEGCVIMGSLLPVSDLFVFDLSGCS